MTVTLTRSCPHCGTSHSGNTKTCEYGSRPSNPDKSLTAELQRPWSMKKTALVTVCLATVLLVMWMTLEYIELLIFAVRK